MCRSGGRVGFPPYTLFVPAYATISYVIIPLCDSCFVPYLLSVPARVFIITCYFCFCPVCRPCSRMCTLTAVPACCPCSHIVYKYTLIVYYSTLQLSTSTEHPTPSIVPLVWCVPCYSQCSACSPPLQCYTCSSASLCKTYSLSSCALCHALCCVRDVCVRVMFACGNSATLRVLMLPL